MDNGVLTVAVVHFGHGTVDMPYLALYSALPSTMGHGLAAVITAIITTTAGATIRHLVNAGHKPPLTIRPKVSFNNQANHFKAPTQKPKPGLQEQFQNQDQAPAQVDLEVLMQSQVAYAVVHREPAVAFAAESNRRYRND